MLNLQIFGCPKIIRKYLPKAEDFYRQSITMIIFQYSKTTLTPISIACLFSQVQAALSR
jgi:hypothetical protein